MKQLLRMIVSTATSFITANPVDRTTTWAIDQTVALKRAGSRMVTNSKTSFTSRMISVVPPKPGCEDSCSSDSETVIVKTSISGSIENKDVVDKAVKDHIANLLLAYPDAIGGFINRSAEYAVNHDEA